MIFSLSLALALSAAGTETAASDATPVTETTATETPAPKPKKPRKICRKPEVSGSRMSRSICHTADEWREIDRAARGFDDAEMTTKSH